MWRLWRHVVLLLQWESTSRSGLWRIRGPNVIWLMEKRLGCCELPKVLYHSVQIWGMQPHDLHKMSLRVLSLRFARSQLRRKPFQESLIPMRLRLVWHFWKAASLLWAREAAFLHSMDVVKILDEHIVQGQHLLEVCNMLANCPSAYLRDCSPFLSALPSDSTFLLVQALAIGQREPTLSAQGTWPGNESLVLWLLPILQWQRLLRRV